MKWQLVVNGILIKCKIDEDSPVLSMITGLELILVCRQSALRDFVKDLAVNYCYFPPGLPLPFVSAW